MQIRETLRVWHARIPPLGTAGKLLAAVVVGTFAWAMTDDNARPNLLAELWGVGLASVLIWLFQEPLSEMVHQRAWLRRNIDRITPKLETIAEAAATTAGNALGLPDLPEELRGPTRADRRHAADRVRQMYGLEVEPRLRSSAIDRFGERELSLNVSLASGALQGLSISESVLLGQIPELRLALDRFLLACENYLRQTSAAVTLADIRERVGDDEMYRLMESSVAHIVIDLGLRAVELCEGCSDVLHEVRRVP